MSAPDPSTWETTSPDDDWESFKEAYWEQETHLRPVHTPPTIRELPPLTANQAQVVGYISKQHISYNKYGDMKVIITIPGQFAAQGHRLFGLTDRLVSVDVVVFPELDMEVPLEEQLDDGWWEHKPRSR